MSDENVNHLMAAIIYFARYLSAKHSFLKVRVTSLIVIRCRQCAGQQGCCPSQTGYGCEINLSGSHHLILFSDRLDIFITGGRKARHEVTA